MALIEPFYIVATLIPQPGKAQEIIDALQPLTEYVQANEPGCLQYQMHRPSGPGVDADSAPIVMIELYKDIAALDTHRKSEMYQGLMKTAAEANLLAAPPDIKVLQPVGGFGPRA